MAAWQIETGNNAAWLFSPQLYVHPLEGTAAA